jgi:hypothetical protein
MRWAAAATHKADAVATNLPAATSAEARHAARQECKLEATDTTSEEMYNSTFTYEVCGHAFAAFLCNMLAG